LGGGLSAPLSNFGRMIYMSIAQREIKFRLFNKKQNRMIAWDDIPGIYGIKILRDNNETEDFSSWMQYTGLKDKNGKEIYEGDIVHSLSPFYTGEGTIHDYDDDYYKVVWKEEEAAFRLQAKNGLYSYFDELIEPSVSGNIYENSELLEESK
jgi:hypothetical protein